MTRLNSASRSTQPRRHLEAASGRPIGGLLLYCDCRGDVKATHPATSRAGSPSALLAWPCIVAETPAQACDDLGMRAGHAQAHGLLTRRGGNHSASAFVLNDRNGENMHIA